MLGILVSMPSQEQLIVFKPVEISAEIYRPSTGFVFLSFGEQLITAYSCKIDVKNNMFTFGVSEKICKIVKRVFSY